LSPEWFEVRVEAERKRQAGEVLVEALLVLAVALGQEAAALRAAVKAAMIVFRLAAALRTLAALRKLGDFLVEAGFGCPLAGDWFAVRLKRLAAYCLQAELELAG
jgi:hypothetical protein